MKYAKEKTSPLALLEASKAMEDARKAVGRALHAVNGQVRTKLLDDYIKLEERLRGEAMRLEDDFAALVSAKFNVPLSSVPLFGSAENLDLAEQFLNTLTRGGE